MVCSGSTERYVEAIPVLPSERRSVESLGCKDQLGIWLPEGCFAEAVIVDQSSDQFIICRVCWCVVVQRGSESTVTIHLAWVNAVVKRSKTGC